MKLSRFLLLYSGRKRRTSNPDVMDECTAALVLMSLSASPRSPTFMTERKAPREAVCGARGMDVR